jgi:hypothetical protein
VDQDLNERILAASSFEEALALLDPPATHCRWCGHRLDKIWIKRRIDEHPMCEPAMQQLIAESDRAFEERDRLR